MRKFSVIVAIIILSGCATQNSWNSQPTAYRRPVDYNALIAAGIAMNNAAVAQTPVLQPTPVIRTTCRRDPYGNVNCVSM